MPCMVGDHSGVSVTVGENIGCVVRGKSHPSDVVGLLCRETARTA